MSDAGESTAPAEVVLRVQLRAEHAAQLRAFAAREGATPEALAALWLEEKLDEAQRHRPRSLAPIPPADAEEMAGE